MRFALALILLPAFVASPAITATNAVPPGTAGAGAASVSGYTVSEISYALAGETVEGVSFRLDRPGATTVRARLTPAAPWAVCTVTGAAVSCPATTPLAEVTALAVIAAG